MPYTLDWLEENRVVAAVITGHFSEEEIVQHSLDIRDNYLEVGAKPVHIISDVGGITSYPRNLAVLRRAVQSFTNHPNLGWLVVHGNNNPVVNFMISTITQIMRVKFRYVATREDALETLRRVDLTLDDNVSK